VPDPNANPLFHCSTCFALYQVTKAEAGAETVDREIACRVCDAPLPAREGQSVLKYFLLREASRIDVRRARQARLRAKPTAGSCGAASARAEWERSVRRPTPGRMPQERGGWPDEAVERTERLGRHAGGGHRMREKMSFEAPTRAEANRLADEWWARQKGLRLVERSQVSVSLAPPLADAERWAVVIHFEAET